MKIFPRVLVMSLVTMLLIVASLWSQGIFATLTGVVTDSTGAVVPNAKITLRNSESGDVRETVADNQGYYTFASVPVGGYNLSIEATGFQVFNLDYAQQSSFRALAPLG